MNVTNYVSTI